MRKIRFQYFFFRAQAYYVGLRKEEDQFEIGSVEPGARLRPMVDWPAYSSELPRFVPWSETQFVVDSDDKVNHPTFLFSKDKFRHMAAEPDGHLWDSCRQTFDTRHTCGETVVNVAPGILVVNGVPIYDASPPFCALPNGVIFTRKERYLYYRGYSGYEYGKEDRAIGPLQGDKVEGLYMPPSVNLVVVSGPAGSTYDEVILEDEGRYQAYPIRKVVGEGSDSPPRDLTDQIALQHYNIFFGHTVDKTDTPFGSLFNHLPAHSVSRTVSYTNRIMRGKTIGLIFLRDPNDAKLDVLAAITTTVQAGIKDEKGKARLDAILSRDLRNIVKSLQAEEVQDIVRALQVQLLQAEVPLHSLVFSTGRFSSGKNYFNFIPVMTTHALLRYLARGPSSSSKSGQQEGGGTFAERQLSGKLHSTFLNSPTILVDGQTLGRRKSSSQVQVGITRIIKKEIVQTRSERRFDIVLGKYVNKSIEEKREISVPESQTVVISALADLDQLKASDIDRLSEGDKMTLLQLNGITSDDREAVPVVPPVPQTMEDEDKDFERVDLVTPTISDPFHVVVVHGMLELVWRMHRPQKKRATKEDPFLQWTELFAEMIGLTTKEGSSPRVPDATSVSRAYSAVAAMANMSANQRSRVRDAIRRHHIDIPFTDELREVNRTYKGAYRTAILYEYFTHHRRRKRHLTAFVDEMYKIFPELESASISSAVADSGVAGSTSSSKSGTTTVATAPLMTARLPRLSLWNYAQSTDQAAPYIYGYVQSYYATVPDEVYVSPLFLLLAWEDVVEAFQNADAFYRAGRAVVGEPTRDLPANSIQRMRTHLAGTTPFRAEVERPRGLRSVHWLLTEHIERERLGRTRGEPPEIFSYDGAEKYNGKNLEFTFSDGKADKTGRPSKTGQLGRGWIMGGFTARLPLRLSAAPASKDAWDRSVKNPEMKGSTRFFWYDKVDRVELGQLMESKSYTLNWIETRTDTQSLCSGVGYIRQGRKVAPPFPSLTRKQYVHALRVIQSTSDIRRQRGDTYDFFPRYKDPFELDLDPAIGHKVIAYILHRAPKEDTVAISATPTATATVTATTTTATATTVVKEEAIVVVKKEEEEGKKDVQMMKEEEEEEEAAASSRVSKVSKVSKKERKPAKRKRAKPLPLTSLGAEHIRQSAQQQRLKRSKPAKRKRQKTTRYFFARAAEEYYTFPPEITYIQFTAEGKSYVLGRHDRLLSRDEWRKRFAVLADKPKGKHDIGAIDLSYPSADPTEEEETDNMPLLIFGRLNSQGVMESADHVFRTIVDSIHTSSKISVMEERLERDVIHFLEDGPGETFSFFRAEMPRTTRPPFYYVRKDENGSNPGSEVVINVTLDINGKGKNSPITTAALLHECPYLQDVHPIPYYSYAYLKRLYLEKFNPKADRKLPLVRASYLQVEEDPPILLFNRYYQEDLQSEGYRYYRQRLPLVNNVLSVIRQAGVTPPKSLPFVEGRFITAWARLHIRRWFTASEIEKIQRTVRETQAREKTGEAKEEGRYTRMGNDDIVFTAKSRTVQDWQTSRDWTPADAECQVTLQQDGWIHFQGIVSFQEVLEFEQRIRRVFVNELSTREPALPSSPLLLMPPPPSSVAPEQTPPPLLLMPPPPPPSRTEPLPRTRPLPRLDPVPTPTRESVVAAYRRRIAANRTVAQVLSEIERVKKEMAMPKSMFGGSRVIKLREQLKTLENELAGLKGSATSASTSASTSVSTSASTSASESSLPPSTSVPEPLPTSVSSLPPPPLTLPTSRAATRPTPASTRQHVPAARRPRRTVEEVQDKINQLEIAMAKFMSSFGATTPTQRELLKDLTKELAELSSSET